MEVLLSALELRTACILGNDAIKPGRPTTVELGETQVVDMDEDVNVQVIDKKQTDQFTIDNNNTLKDRNSLVKLETEDMANIESEHTIAETRNKVDCQTKEPEYLEDDLEYHDNTEKHPTPLHKIEKELGPPKFVAGDKVIQSKPLAFIINASHRFEFLLSF